MLHENKIFILITIGSFIAVLLICLINNLVALKGFKKSTKEFNDALEEQKKLTQKRIELLNIFRDTPQWFDKSIIPMRDITYTNTSIPVLIFESAFKEFHVGFYSFAEEKWLRDTYDEAMERLYWTYLPKCPQNSSEKSSVKT